MTAIQDKLKALADKFKRSGGLDQKRLDNMKKVAEEAKKASQEVKGQKG